jgi:hypothetical protein
MFEIPETVETNRVTGATIVNLGFMSQEAAAKFKAALHGQTFMNFNVCCAVSPGGPYVSISTTYKESPVGILAFALNVLAGA